MKIYNLNLESHNGETTATYKVDDSELTDLPTIIEKIRDHLKDHQNPYVLRLAVRPVLPIPKHSMDSLYMYVSPEMELGTLLEKKLRIESQKHVIRNQEDLLEDLMFGIVRQGTERIPYRMDCDTYLQFNINNNNIDVTVMCKTVDFVIPVEWEGDPVSLLEKVDSFITSHGFNRGFGSTPEINLIKI